MVVPLLFNVLLDFIVKEALRVLPNYKVEVELWSGGELVYTFGSRPLSLGTIAMLLYVNNMVMFNTDVGKLVEMLRVVDFWASEMAKRINVAKTKIMSVGKGAPQLLVHTPICNGSMQLVESFKYLGSIVNSQASLQEEINTCHARGLGVFAQFSHV